MKREEYLKIQEELESIIVSMEKNDNFPFRERNTYRAAILEAKNVLANHNPDLFSDQSRDCRMILDGVAASQEGLQPYYFTYGTHEQFPFYRGYTVVFAPSKEAACQIFRAYHPNRPGSSALNCAIVYTHEKFQKTEMCRHPEEKCHEIIGAFSPDNELVHCKGCEHRDTVLWPMSNACEDFPWRDTRDNDFCSYGKCRMNSEEKKHGE